MTKFVHIADTHLRASQYYKPGRGEDFFQSLMFCARTTHSLGLNHILHSGDLLDSSRPTARVLHQLAELDRFLKEHQITMYTILGNHDRTTPPWHAAFADPGNEYGIKDVSGTRFEFEGVTVNALPFMSKVQFLEQEQTMDPATILMWHGQVQEFTDAPLSEEAMTLAEFPQDKYDLILLGDIHVHKQFEIGPRPTIVTMPGSTELCRDSEEVDKYMDVWEVGDARPRLESRKIPTRTVYRCEIRTEEDLERVLSELKKVDQVARVNDEYALIYIKYDPAVAGVTGRIHAQVDPQHHVVRCRHIPTAPQAMPDTGHMEQDVAPVDFLSEFVSEKEPVWDLGEILLRPDLTQAEAQDHLEKFVSEQLDTGGIGIH